MKVFFVVTVLAAALVTADHYGNSGVDGHTGTGFGFGEVGPYFGFDHGKGHEKGHIKGQRYSQERSHEYGHDHDHGFKHGHRSYYHGHAYVDGKHGTHFQAGLGLGGSRIGSGIVFGVPGSYSESRANYNHGNKHPYGYHSNLDGIHKGHEQGGTRFGDGSGFDKTDLGSSVYEHNKYVGGVHTGIGLGRTRIGSGFGLAGAGTYARSDARTAGVYSKLGAESYDGPVGHRQASDNPGYVSVDQNGIITREHGAGIHSHGHGYHHQGHRDTVHAAPVHGKFRIIPGFDFGLANSYAKSGILADGSGTYAESDAGSYGGALEHGLVGGGIGSFAVSHSGFGIENHFGHLTEEHGEASVSVYNSGNEVAYKKHDGDTKQTTRTGAEESYGKKHIVGPGQVQMDNNNGHKMENEVAINNGSAYVEVSGIDGNVQTSAGGSASTVETATDIKIDDLAGANSKTEEGDIQIDDGEKIRMHVEGSIAATNGGEANSVSGTGESNSTSHADSAVESKFTDGHKLETDVDINNGCAVVEEFAKFQGNVDKHDDGRGSTIETAHGILIAAGAGAREYDSGIYNHGYGYGHQEHRDTQHQEHREIQTVSDATVNTTIGDDGIIAVRVVPVVIVDSDGNANGVGSSAGNNAVGFVPVVTIDSDGNANAVASSASNGTVTDSLVKMVPEKPTGEGVSTHDHENGYVYERSSIPFVTGRKVIKDQIKYVYESKDENVARKLATNVSESSAGISSVSGFPVKTDPEIQTVTDAAVTSTIADDGNIAVRVVPVVIVDTEGNSNVVASSAGNNAAGVVPVVTIDSDGNANAVASSARSGSATDSPLKMVPEKPTRKVVSTDDHENGYVYERPSIPFVTGTKVIGDQIKYVYESKDETVARKLATNVSESSAGISSVSGFPVKTDPEIQTVTDAAVNPTIADDGNISVRVVPAVIVDSDGNANSVASSAGNNAVGFVPIVTIDSDGNANGVASSDENSSRSELPIKMAADIQTVTDAAVNSTIGNDGINAIRVMSGIVINSDGKVNVVDSAAVKIQSGSGVGCHNLGESGENKSINFGGLKLGYGSGYNVACSTSSSASASASSSSSSSSHSYNRGVHSSSSSSSSSASSSSSSKNFRISNAPYYSIEKLS